MHADGAMNPFVLTYAWRLDPDDPRLGRHRDHPQRGPLERLAGLIAGAAG